MIKALSIIVVHGCWSGLRINMLSDFITVIFFLVGGLTHRLKPLADFYWYLSGVYRMCLPRWLTRTSWGLLCLLDPEPHCPLSCPVGCTDCLLVSKSVNAESTALHSDHGIIGLPSKDVWVPGPEAPPPFIEEGALTYSNVMCAPAYTAKCFFYLTFFFRKMTNFLFISTSKP